MNATSRSVLITGANGFVGSHLCRRFLDEGFQVVAGVRQTSDLSMLQGFKLSLAYGDIRRPETLPAVVRAVDYIVHNAGIVKAKSRRAFFDVNEQGTRNLFESIAEFNPTVKRVAYISSVAAAGPSVNGRPISEDDAPHPISAYGESKLGGETVARSFASRFEVVVVRPPGIYGPGDRETLPFFQTVSRWIKPVIGNQGRRMQLVYVDDLCEGVLKAMLSPAKSGSIFFIAENRSYAMRELIHLLQQACGVKGVPLYLPGPVFRAVALFSEFLGRLVGATPMLTRDKAREILSSWEVTTVKARDEIGYESGIPFARGVEQTLSWYKEQGWL